MTPVGVLTMIDDVFSISNCGPESTQIQEYLNIKTASKKLQYATENTFLCMLARKIQDMDAKTPISIVGRVT